MRRTRRDSIQWTRRRGADRSLR